MTQAPVELALVDDAFLAARAQYFQFLERSVETNQVWGLRDQQGFVQFGCQDDICLPVWADQDEANACAQDEWEGCEAVSIPMKVWAGQWLSNMVRKKARLVISPNDVDECVVIEPLDIQQDTLAALRAANIAV